MKVWQILVLLLDLMAHAYLLFGLAYSWWLTRDSAHYREVFGHDPTWNPLPTIKLMFWWVPTFLARRGTE